jgi:hypothetical protein
LKVIFFLLLDVDCLLTLLTALIVGFLGGFNKQLVIIDQSDVRGIEIQEFDAL